MLGFKKKATREEIITAKAVEITEKINYPLLRIGWLEYQRIERRSEAYDGGDYETHLYITPAWFGLKKLIELKGHFDGFSVYELYLLKSLKDGYLNYDEVMHVLMDHHNNEAEGQHLFAAHPSLHEHLPQQYDNAQQVIKVLVEIMNQFRWEIEHFGQEYGKDIDEAIAQIIRKAGKK